MSPLFRALKAWTTRSYTPVEPSSVRQLSSQCRNTYRILLKPLPHASLDRYGGGFFAPNRNDASHHCEDFTLILKPFPRHLVDHFGQIDESKLLPHWLPFPPHPSTHQRRHLGLSSHPPPSPATVQEQDRWEPLPGSLPVESGPKFCRPVLRTFVMSTKKRIHKLAVIRHHTRARLIAALRSAVFRLQDAGADVEDMLKLRKNVVMLIASPSAYAKDMEALVQEMEKALYRVTAPPKASSRTKTRGPASHHSKQHFRREDTQRK